VRSGGLLALIVSFSTTYYRGTIDVSAGRLPPEFGNVLIYASDLFLLLAVGGWLFGQLSDPDRTIRLAPWGPALALTTLAAWGSLSLLWCSALPLSAAFALRLWLLLALYLLVGETPAPLRLRMEQLWIGASLIQALVGLGQFFHQGNLGLAWAGELVRDALVPGAIVVQVGDRLWLRAAGLTSSPNALGALLVVGSTILLGRYLSEERLSLGRQLGTAAGTLLLVMGALATFTRTAWGGLAVGCTLSLGVPLLRGSSPERRRALALALCLIVVLIVWAVAYWPLFAARLSGTVALLAPQRTTPNATEQQNIAQRTHYQHSALALWRSHPWLGVGLANSSLVALVERGVPADLGVAPVHSVPLMLLVELGPVGLLCWVVLSGSVVTILWRQRHALLQEPMSRAWTAAVLALLFMGLFDHHFLTYQQGRVLLWLTLGIWSVKVV
jgi:O-antigen ligase